MLLVLAQSQPGYPPGRERIFRFRSELANNGAPAAATGCSPACTAPQFCSGSTCTDPQLSFATASGIGMTAECAGTAITTVQGGAVTFTRASSAYCTIGNVNSGLSNSSMVLLTNDQPRVMNGGNGTGPAGLRVEPAHTNLLLRSQEFDVAAVWIPVSSVAPFVNPPTVTANAAVAPDGTTTADRIQIDATTGVTNGYSILAQVATGCTAAACSGSVYLKGVSGAGNIEITGGATIPGVITTVCSYVSTSWTKCAFTNVDQSGGGNANVIGVNTVGHDGTNGYPAIDVYAWQFDGVAGVHLYSPVLTTSASATAAADVATTPYTAAGGTLSMSATIVSRESFLASETPYQLYFSANDQTIGLIGTTSSTPSLISRFRIGGTSNNVTSSALLAINSSNNVASYYDGTNRAACVGGVCTRTAGALTLPTGAGTVYIGGRQAGAGFELGTVVKNLCVDPTHCPSYGL